MEGKRRNESRRVCIIPCGRKKIWDKQPQMRAVPARQAYISPFGRACQRYAATFFQHWFFLSAKHGFLHPNDLVPENYDVTFGMPNREIISPVTLRQQAADKGLDHFAEIVALTGKKYKPVLETVFAGKTIRYPLEGYRGIGMMLKALNEAEAGQKELDG